MRPQKELELRTLVTMHSAFLTVVSALLLTGFVLVLAEKIYTYSPWEMICSTDFHDDGESFPAQKSGSVENEVMAACGWQGGCKCCTTSTTSSNGTSCWIR